MNGYDSYEDTWMGPLYELAGAEAPAPRFNYGRGGLQGVPNAINAAQNLAASMAPYYDERDQRLAQNIQWLNQDVRTMRDIVDSGDQGKIDRNLRDIAQRIVLIHDQFATIARRRKLRLPALPELAQYADRWRNM